MKTMNELLGKNKVRTINTILSECDKVYPDVSCPVGEKYASYKHPYTGEIIKISDMKLAALVECVLGYIQVQLMSDDDFYMITSYIQQKNHKVYLWLNL